jgi:trk system potassium uptake protein TrkA
MSQQILIIGLGQFGMSLARTLSDKGAEVLAGDRRPTLVDEAAAFVTEAVVIDATDETELARLHPKQRDCAVCAIGDDSKEASIICTALLRQMGSPWVIGRANNAMHRRILQLVGAHLVVNPEEEFGRRFANRLVYRNVIADMPLGDDLHLTELAVHASMVGKTLVELALPKRFGVMVVAIRRGVPSKVLQPAPHDPLQAEDRLIIVSSETAIPKLAGGI